jgi:hypothetical protein
VEGEKTAGDGASNNRTESAFPAAPNDGDEVFLLHQHAADQHHFGPGHISICEPLNVRVYETFLPGLGKKRSHCHLTERWLRRALAPK